MITSSRQSSRSPSAAWRSLWSVSATVILAAITHAYEFGTLAFVVGAIVIAALAALSGRIRRTGSRLALVAYGLLNLWIIGGFGIVGGLWNHTVKVVASAANGGALPASLQRLFMSPDLGSATYEAVGILTFITCVFAATFGYRLARTVRWTARTDAPEHGAAGPSPTADA